MTEENFPSADSMRKIVEMNTATNTELQLNTIHAEVNKAAIAGKYEANVDIGLSYLLPAVKSLLEKKGYSVSLWHGRDGETICKIIWAPSV